MEAYLAMQAKEEEAQTEEIVETKEEEEVATLLDSLRSLLSKGQYPLFTKKPICRIHARKQVIHSSNG